MKIVRVIFAALRNSKPVGKPVGNPLAKWATGLKKEPPTGGKNPLEVGFFPTRAVAVPLANPLQNPLPATPKSTPLHQVIREGTKSFFEPAPGRCTTARTLLSDDEIKAAAERVPVIVALIEDLHPATRIRMLQTMLAQEICFLPASERDDAVAISLKLLPVLKNANEVAMRDLVAERARAGTL